MKRLCQMKVMFAVVVIFAACRGAEAETYRVELSDITTEKGLRHAERARCAAIGNRGVSLVARERFAER